jgi:hypothetical protein
MIKALPVSELLKTILTKSSDLRSARKAAFLAAHQTKNSSKDLGTGIYCKNCEELANENKCIRVLPATFVDNSELHGCCTVPYSMDDPDSVQPQVSYIGYWSL